MAFRIDGANLFERLGLEKLIELSTAFYTRVYADELPEFRAMFPPDMDSAIRNQYEFFAQRLGGPPLYSQRKGHPALKARHVKFPITEAFAVRWLAHMRAAMNDAAIPEDAQEALWEFFENTAHFLVNVEPATE